MQLKAERARPLPQTSRLLALVAVFASAAALPGVLPEDRVDVLYHRYQGGGVTVDGPSILLRKKIGESFSVAANYYVDMISSASIDVLSNASPYKEQRKQYSLSASYLRGKSTYSAGVINSDEADYKAKTGYFNISQDMFGDLTTVSFGFTRGKNDVMRNVKGVTDPTFREKLDSRTYSLGLSQVLTRNLLLGVNFETITDQGFLNSPYRSARFLDPTDPRGYGFEAERYPNTHTSNAISGSLKYYLWYRAALTGQYRFYSDTWGIRGQTLQIGYTHPLWKNWVFDGDFRYYRQNAADFYSDLFPRANSQNFLARDRELAAFSSNSIGLGASYQFHVPRARWIEKSTLNFKYDRIMIKYTDFRNDLVRNVPAGTEPLYELDANVFQLFFSIWY
jgi:hypothetical protein